MTRLRRRANRGFYRLLFGAYRLLFPSSAPRGRLPASSVRRVLIVRHDALGDMAVTLPAIAYLRATLPHAEIDVLASARNAALLAGDTRVTNVIVADGRLSFGLVRRLRARDYDAIISPLLRNGLREGLLAALVAPRHAARITPWRQIRYLGLFTHPCRTVPSERHMATRLLALVQRTIGDGGVANVRQYPAALACDAGIAPSVQPPFVALNAWAAEGHRNFGVPLTIAIARGLVARGHRVVLTAPPGREREAEEVAAAVPNAIVAPPGNIAQLVALLREASIVVTPDTANVHLASAVGTPVVSVHTPIGTDVRDWGPWGVPHRTVVLPGPQPLAETPPESVLAAFDELLKSEGTTSRQHYNKGNERP